MLGTRTPAKLEDWDWKTPKGLAGSIAETAAFGEILVLAVKGTAARIVRMLQAIEDRKSEHPPYDSPAGARSIDTRTEAAFDSTPPRDGATRLGPALEAAAARGGAVVVITDGEVSDIPDLAPDLLTRPRVIRLPRPATWDAHKRANRRAAAAGPRSRGWPQRGRHPVVRRPRKR